MPSIASAARTHAMWVCLYGPALSFLPPRWRDNAFARRYAGWRGSTYVTASLELFFALQFVGLYFMGRAPQRPAFLWLILYLAIDGPWRALTARFEGIAVPTLLFAVADEGFLAARKALFDARHPDLPDSISLDEQSPDHQLRIESARSKRDWEPGRIIRCGDRYFRLESALQQKGSHPFVYLLRALEAGVPGPAVRTYSGALPASSNN